ncbi:type II secretion system minor pseudopilin GspI [Crenobacter caeni]|uniref:Type II secretion system protein I n=1 Tax=Crenobacter caeni TaxID=2705474 RepID=A0A6B2KTK6_9NEIS|nr:type II secretion system minor pseudopilin GspI [Crenobacter caeni]
MKRARGFTLFEVLVALAIMAIALTALLRASALAADNSERLRLSMLASWEAQNRIETMKALGEWPDIGGTSGEVVLVEGAPALRWQRDVSDTPNPGFRRVVVRILAAGPEPYALAELTGFVRRPR